MQRFDAVIFDMDGVLIDSEPLHYAVSSQVLAADGLAHLAQAEYEQFIGTTVDYFFDTLIARYNLPGSVADYTARYDAALLDALAQPREPSPGVRSLIARLQAQTVRLAVASSSQRSWINATLRSLDLSDVFETTVSGEDVARGKPDPAIYLLAAERLGVAPNRCLAIEDSPKGVASARSAGMTVLGVRTPYTAHLHLAGVERIVDSLAELDLSGDILR